LGLLSNGHGCVHGPAEDQDVADLERLRQAMALIDGGDAAAGERVLRGVCSGSPTRYECISVDGRTCYIAKQAAVSFFTDLMNAAIRAMGLE